jgi:hypothetical protein
MEYEFAYIIRQLEAYWRLIEWMHYLYRPRGTAPGPRGRYRFGGSVPAPATSPPLEPSPLVAAQDRTEYKYWANFWEHLSLSIASVLEPPQYSKCCGTSIGEDTLWPLFGEHTPGLYSGIQYCMYVCYINIHACHLTWHFCLYRLGSN